MLPSNNTGSGSTENITICAEYTTILHSPLALVSKALLDTTFHGMFELFHKQHEELFHLKSEILQISEDTKVLKEETNKFS